MDIKIHIVCKTIDCKSTNLLPEWEFLLPSQDVEMFDSESHNQKMDVDHQHESMDVEEQPDSPMDIDQQVHWTGEMSMDVEEQPDSPMDID